MDDDDAPHDEDDEDGDDVCDDDDGGGYDCISVADWCDWHDTNQIALTIMVNMMVPHDDDDGDLLYLLDNDYCRILQWRCSHAEMILQKRENEATCLFSSLRVLAKPKNWTQQSTSFISVWHYSSLYVWYIYSRNAGQTKLKTHRWWHQCVCTRYVIACHKLEMSPKNRFNIFHCCISKTHKMSHLFNNSISTNSKT